MPTKGDKEFGQAAVAMAFATEADVTAGLEKQRALEKEGALLTLDQVLRESGRLTPVQVELLLEQQGRKIVYCTGCTSKYNVITAAGGSKVTCRKCQATIHVPVRLLGRPVSDDPAPPPPQTDPGAPDPLLGKMLGGYRVETLLLRGGMGIVYKAHQISLDRPVALKVLPPDLTRDPTYVKRFLAEAKAAGRLQHPHIIQVYDIGEANGTYYFSMEYVEGESLATLLKERSPLGLETSVRIAIQIAKALVHAHKANVLHRDIRPATIMITEEGVAKLAELGFTKALDEQAVLGVGGGGLESPFYLAPEQITDSTRVGPPADIYSLAATLYRMVAGARPFPGDNVMDVLKGLLKGSPVPPHTVRAEVPEDLSDLILHGMARRPEDRFASAAQMLGALRELDMKTDSGRIPREERVPLSERLRELTRRLTLRGKKDAGQWGARFPRRTAADARRGRAGWG